MRPSPKSLTRHDAPELSSAKQLHPERKSLATFSWRTRKADIANGWLRLRNEFRAVVASRRLRTGSPQATNPSDKANG